MPRVSRTFPLIWGHSWTVCSFCWPPRTRGRHCCPVIYPRSWPRKNSCMPAPSSGSWANTSKAAEAGSPSLPRQGANCPRAFPWPWKRPKNTFSDGTADPHPPGGLRDQDRLPKPFALVGFLFRGEPVGKIGLFQVSWPAEPLRDPLPPPGHGKFGRKGFGEQGIPTHGDL